MTVKAMARLARDTGPEETAAPAEEVRSPAPDRALARLQEDDEVAALTLETAKRDNDRAGFLRAMMPLISGNEGKRLVAAFKAQDLDSFRAAWGNVTERMLNKVNPEAMGSA